MVFSSTRVKRSTIRAFSVSGTERMRAEAALVAAMGCILGIVAGHGITAFGSWYMYQHFGESLNWLNVDWYEPAYLVGVIVLAFISLFNIPFGTAIGVYTMWVLLPGQSQEEYDALVATRAE